jgi:hypothetical protein
MQDEKALALFRETDEKTLQGRIPWEPAVLGETLIAAIKGKYSLILTREDDQWRGLVITLTMKDQHDRRIISVDREIEGVEQDDLTNLYEAARRQAYRVDERVDDLISDLKSL